MSKKKSRWKRFIYWLADLIEAIVDLIKVVD